MLEGASPRFAFFGVTDIEFSELLRISPIPTALLAATLYFLKVYPTNDTAEFRPFGIGSASQWSKKAKQGAEILAVLVRDVVRKRVSLDPLVRVVSPRHAATATATATTTYLVLHSVMIASTGASTWFPENW